MRLRLSGVVCLAAAAALAAPLAGCDSKPKQPPHRTPDVDVVVLHPQAVTLKTELPGRLAAHRIAEIRPQVSGVILRRLFEEGQMVKAGQQLYQIDPRPYQATLASAKASVERARATAFSAQQTVNRYRPLAKAFAVSKLDLDNATGALGQARADIASGQASVQSAEVNLAYTKMFAPISGRTGRTLVTEGALVTANQTDALVTVTELDPIYVDVTQPVGTMLRLKREYAAGQLRAAGDEAAEVHLVLDDGTPYAPSGRLLFSEVTVDPSTGSVTMRALFPNPDGLLMPGMFVRETIEEGVRPDGLLVPQRGVTHDAKGQARALVVGADGKVAVRDVKINRSVGEDWLIDSGLAAGDRVIVSGIQAAKPGQDVHAHEVRIDGVKLIPVDQGRSDAPGPDAARPDAHGSDAH